MNRRFYGISKLHSVLACMAFMWVELGASPFTVTLRRQIRENGLWRVFEEEKAWKGEETAIIVCDMWNHHWCAGAERRVAELAPFMNQVLEAARRCGVFVIHAPSGTMKAYSNHPARKRAIEAPPAPDLPEGIGKWCNRIAREQDAVWPIDQSDGGCDCRVPCKKGSPWTSQIDSIRIDPDRDAVSDSGVEIWNLLAAKKIKHVILMGVHTNMCVMGRPFGLRNMVRFGKDVVLMRDMTDTMYNHRRPPHVRHFAGTDLIIEYIERYICPTITSTVFTGKPFFRFRNDPRPHVVLISAESEYGSWYSFPALAHLFVSKMDLSAEVLQGSTSKQDPNRHRIPGMEALKRADLVLLFVRRRALPEKQMDLFKAYLRSGKPLVAFRTSSHAFAPHGRVPPGCVTWPAFGREVLGCNYQNHWRGGMVVTCNPYAAGDPLLAGLSGRWYVAETLYRNRPLAPGCRLLLMGSWAPAGKDQSPAAKGKATEIPSEPVAWTRLYGRSKVFYAALGKHTVSFRTLWFTRLVLNAVGWALGRRLPVKGVKPLFAKP